MTKKIKVQLTSKKSAYAIEGQIYHPGDIFEIAEIRFDSSCMVKVEEPKKPAKPPKEEPKSEETSLVEEVTSDVIAARTAPKVQKRKKA